MTRARDHLALTTIGKTDWLNELAADDGQPLIRLPSERLAINGQTFALRPASAEAGRGGKGTGAGVRTPGRGQTAASPA